MLALLHLQLPQGLLFFKKGNVCLLALLMVSMENKTVLARELCEGFVSVCEVSLRFLMCYDLLNPTAAVFVSSPSCELVVISCLCFEAENQVLLCCF